MDLNAPACLSRRSQFKQFSIYRVYWAMVSLIMARNFKAKSHLSDCYNTVSSRKNKIKKNWQREMEDPFHPDSVRITLDMLRFAFKLSFEIRYYRLQCHVGCSNFAHYHSTSSDERERIANDEKKIHEEWKCRTGKVNNIDFELVCLFIELIHSNSMLCLVCCWLHIS